MAFVPTWGYLTLCRILLGAFEVGRSFYPMLIRYLPFSKAAFFPALVFIISTWCVSITDLLILKFIHTSWRYRVNSLFTAIQPCGFWRPILIAPWGSKEVWFRSCMSITLYLTTLDRLAAFYLLSVTISGFSSILAYALSLLDGKRGIAGWSWIFVIELLLLLCTF